MPRFSHSKIETFRRCPRQFFYKYVARLKLPDVSEQVATFFGSRCHDALEWLYGEIMIGVVPSRESVLAEFNRGWEAEWTDGIVIRDAGMTGERYRKLGEVCVGRYFDAHHPFDDATTIGLEENIRFELEDGVNMTGFIDRLSKDADGTWHIHDYKTNKKLPTQADKDADPQLAYYEIGIRQMWPDKVDRVELHWHFLRFGETITSTRTPNQLNELRENALEAIHDALSRGKDESAFEPIETALCNYCDYQSVCPVKKHEFRINGLPANEYAGEPGVSLVNRWAELRSEKSDLSTKIAEIDEKVSSLKQALADYAAREGCSVVVGDIFEATVRQSEQVSFPRKSYEPDEYESLRRKLELSPFWSLVSCLDASRLRALWLDRGALDPALREILGEFVRLENQQRIGLRKQRT